MINHHLIQTYAESLLHTSSVRFVREIPLHLPGCSLSIWATTRQLPACHVAIFEANDELVCTTESMPDFERMLKVLGPSVFTGDILSRLFREAAPGMLRVVDSKKNIGWLARYDSIWHEPHQGDGGIIFFCADLLRGRFYRMMISSAFELFSEDLGPGKRMAKQ